MVRKLLLTVLLVALTIMSSSCLELEMGGGGSQFTGAKGEVKIMTLDPGHFHAALVQKVMYDQVSPTVYVYAPKGPDVVDHLKRIEGFNTRSDNPTDWREVVYTGDDFLEKMLAERPGNVVVLSGNNKKKTRYIKACVDAGLNVFADKPMCITPEDFELLKEAFVSAKEHGVLIYDIMTERSEITTILQKELSQVKGVFGKLQKGTPDDPAVVQESVHHFFKYVSGNPIKRPGWYFDTTQQGEGIVDVTTHLVDLAMWGALPGEVIDYADDIEILKTKRWPTMITLEQYQKVTRLDDFPPYLKERLDDNGVLPCYANGETTYSAKGINMRVSVTWNYQAPEGTKDTHYSIMKGSKCSLVVRQGAEQNYRTELYVEPVEGIRAGVFAKSLVKAVDKLQGKYPGVKLDKLNGAWHIEIPDKYRIGHEAHFGEVTKRYLQYLVDGKLPNWEEPNMIAKYYTNTTALKMASEK
ncbi:MAG: Gfo/Idh/MocA family oxidoreductase [Planctomycetes bacterium]|nr:Gfo/Idh/MocA family oxidoreductase [Planctomycetota bacterium]